MNNFWQDPNTGTWYIEKKAYFSNIRTAIDAADHAQRRRKVDKTTWDPTLHIAGAFLSPGAYSSYQINQMDPDAKRSTIGHAIKGKVGGAIGGAIGARTGIDILPSFTRMAGAEIANSWIRDDFNKLSKKKYK